MQTTLYVPQIIPATTVHKLTNRIYTLRDFRQIPQMRRLSEEQRFAIEVVGRVVPFQVNHYVIEKLIDWDNVPDDPLFILTFPQKDMLQPDHFEELAYWIRSGASEQRIQEAAARIRRKLNPHPDGQMEHNVPIFEGKPLRGMQHKYRETVLFFPSQGQTCYTYCSYCFRWAQFVGESSLKFAMREGDSLKRYLRQHPEVTDVLFTGGDPLIMNARTLKQYIEALLMDDLPNLTTIRIGTKALTYWPYRFSLDEDAQELLALFKRVTQSGRHLAIMAHFSHPRELENNIVRDAIARIQETGAQIRTQAPLMAHINDDAKLWSQMWKTQVALGCIPYYMFIARDTGAQHYFSVPLERAWRIFKEAYQSVSGVVRTVRGPCMSSHPGKIQILGVSEIYGEKVFVLQFLQGRKATWVSRPFFARYDEKATWLDELRPAFGEEAFFFEEALVG